MKSVLPLLAAFCLFAPKHCLGQESAPKPDIRVYKTVGGTKLTAHIFRPASADLRQLFPAVVLFHGGGWIAGSPEWVYGAAEGYARQGAVAIAVEYRLIDQKTITPIDALADARDLMEWVTVNAPELKIDTSRIAAYGVSAGGQLAAALVTIEDPEQRDTAASPAALVLISPAVSVMHDGWFHRILLDKATVASQSPDEHITRRIPPTIIFQGGADTLVPVGGVRTFCERAKKYGSDCEVVEYPGVGHLFTRRLDHQEDNFDPDPKDVADSIAKGDAFLAAHGFLPNYSAPVVK